MTRQEAATFAAVGALALLAGLAGVAAGRRWNRRDWANHRAYTAALETDLAATERERDHLAAEAATFPARLQAAYDAGQAVAREVGTRRDIERIAQVGAWPLPARLRLPPRTWRALTEARDKAGEN